MINPSNFKNLPNELRGRDNFVVWRHEIRDGEKTKVPYDAKSNGNHIHAKSNDPSTWTSFEEAVRVADILSGNDYDGIGIMLQGTNLVGVDFDGVVTPNEDDGHSEIDPYVLKIIEQLGNPYSEFTPSGTGVRCFVECDKLPTGKRKFSDGNHYGIEIYIGTEGGRYLTLTGNKFGGDGVPKVADLEIPYFLISQFRNTKLKKLWMGDASDFANDQSSADLALCDELVKLLGKDPMKVDRYFRASGLMRDKWDEIHNGKDTYGEMTITKALGVKTAYGVEPQIANVKTAKTPKIEVEIPEGMFSIGTDIVLTRVDWFWKDRIPLGKITLFAGNPDNGKSLVSTWIAATTTIGRNFPDCENHTPASEVLMLVGEDDLKDTVGPRLKLAEADLSKIHFMHGMRYASTQEARYVHLDRDMKALEKKLTECPNIRVVIIDPISNYLGDVSMVAEQEVRDVLKLLQDAAAKFNVAVIMVMHLNKKSDQDAISRVGGAMAFIGVARASWLFMRDDPPEEQEGDKKMPRTYSMLRMKNNLAQVEQTGLSYVIKAQKLPELNPPGTVEECWTPYIVWNGDAKIDDANAAMGNRHAKHSEVRANSRDAKVMAAVKWLETELQDGTPKRGTTLIAAARAMAGIAEDHLRTAATTILHVDITKKGKVWWWTLPTLNATGEALAGAAQSDLIEVGE